VWTWCNEEKTVAVMFSENGSTIVCGINIEPVASWLSAGNEPADYVPADDILSNPLA
jgi:hypothetical protein